MLRSKFLVAPLCLCLVTAAQAAIFSVNTTIDQTDAIPGDDICETAPGNRVCTLRAAIEETNALAGPDTVLVPEGAYALAIPGDLENGGLTGDLDVMDGLRIIGDDQSSTILEGAGLDRLLDIDPGGAGITVEISRMTIRGGTLLHNEDIGSTLGGGGGVLVRGGTVQLTNVTLRDNQINNLIQAGGGIWNRGHLTLTNCLVTGSRAYHAGGIANVESGVLTIANSAVSGNTAFGAIGTGGGIFNLSVATLVNTTISGNVSSQSNCGGIQNMNLLGLANVTFSNNGAFRFGGALCNQGAMEVGNSLFASNVASGVANNCRLDGGTVTSDGYNLEDLDTCGLAGTGDMISTNPVLGPLQDNGGSIPTHALLPGSPAIDTGHPAGCVDFTSFPATLTTDQRGQLRPLDGNRDRTARCDIGAYEFDRHDVRGVAASAEPFRITWSALPGASGYTVYRGTVSGLRSGDYGSCQTMNGDLTVTQLQDATVPPPGEILFYLVAARVNDEEWTLGYDSFGLERILQAGAHCPG